MVSGGRNHDCTDTGTQSSQRHSVLRERIWVNFLGINSIFGLLRIACARALLSISVGIVSNCLTVVIFGVMSLIAKDTSIGYQRLFDKNERAKIAHAYPNLMADTLILTVFSLLPFVLFAAVWIEKVDRLRHR